MRKVLVAILFAFLVGQASGQNLEIRDVFKQMPDSLMPYLTQNNKLDFLDFLDSNMKAEVKNRLGGSSEMTGLSADSLSIKMSSSLRTDLFMMPLSAPVDSVSSAVVMVETFLTDSIHGQSRVSYFTSEWKKWAGVPPLSDVQQKRIQINLLQNILKKDEEIVNKH